MAETNINVPRLFAVLDERVQAEGISWRTAASQIGVSPALLSRLRNGQRPDLDAFVLLTRWAGRTADEFLGGDQTTSRRPVEEEVDAVLRARADLTDDERRRLEELFRGALEQVRNESTTD